ncbi:MAG: 16S rRNA processing protein RimM [Ruminococcaceae bacterium]|nr:16S rRNA processing protein RimM [Oscillospiraceae bacterium]
MKNRYLEVGKIVGTHGVKGMTRVQVWADSPDFLKQFKYLYTSESGENKLTVLRVQPHGNISLVAFKGVETIEHAESFRNTVLYIDRKDVKLPEGRYFITDLIGITVFDADSGIVLGEISDVSQTGANDVWHIKKDGKEYLIPAISDVLVNVDIEAEKAVIRPLKGIFDDED